MDTTFKGKAVRIQDIDLPRIGYHIGVGEDELHAFMDVEAAGSGFDDSGRPKMLFEPHKFYAALRGDERAAAVKQGLAYPKWGEKPYPSDSYPRMAKAMAINETAALSSASWGLTQILGTYFKELGFATPQDMVQAFMDSEAEHLEATVTLLKLWQVDDDLRAHRWATVARTWNGAGYAKNRYDTKLAAAFAKWQKIRDTKWSPTDSAPVPAPPVVVAATPAVPVELPPAVTEALPATPASNATVVTVDGPKKDETTVVIAKTPQVQPAPAAPPSSKTGFLALGALILTLLAGIARYVFGG